MRIAPTLQGGLRIDIESMLDWARLELIAIDGARNESTLGLKLGGRMELDKDWIDYVLPDLEADFSSQLQYVHKEVRVARSKDSEKGEIHITSENVGLWYGALNQARIALESELELSQYDEIDSDTVKSLSNEVRSAIIRNHFYTVIQTNLLEQVMGLQ